MAATATAVQPGQQSMCCPIICAGPAPNVKCCPILGIQLNINRHELMNYRRIIKTVATRCQILRLKCTKFDFGLQCLQLLAGFKRPTSEGRDRRGWVGEENGGERGDGNAREGRRRKGG